MTKSLFSRSRWQKSDKRNITPCPVLNMLANYKLLPKDHITSKDLKRALENIGCDNILQYILVDIGTKDFYVKDQQFPIIPLLCDIGKHGKIEHDCSLSRKDIHLGNHIRFNNIRFSRLKKFTKKRTTHISLKEMVQYRIYVENESFKTNPKLEFGPKEYLTAILELSAVYLLLCDESGDIRLDWMDDLFKNEKLPFSKGYTIRNISTSRMIEVMSEIMSYYIIEQYNLVLNKIKINLNIEHPESHSTHRIIQ